MGMGWKIGEINQLACEPGHIRSGHLAEKFIDISINCCNYDWNFEALGKQLHHKVYDLIHLVILNDWNLPTHS